MLVRTIQSKQEITININYQKFVRIFLNAINQTLGYDIQLFSQANVLMNDFLFVIYQNVDKNIRQSFLNYDIVNDILSTSIDQVKQKILTMWVINIVLVFMMFALLYPIIIKSKIEAQESLVLFTFIALREVDFYTSHYKKLHTLFKEISNTSGLIRVIERYIFQAFKQ